MGDCTQGPRVLQVFRIAKSKFVSRKEDVPKTLQSYRLYNLSFALRICRNSENTGGWKFQEHRKIYEHDAIRGNWMINHM